MSVARRRVFPETFKREAVQKAATSGLSTGMVAAELGVHETVLRRWMVQFPLSDSFDSQSHQPTLATYTATTDLFAENARLRLENERLRADRDTLKKALAIVFEELK
jgi:transposase